MNQSPLCHLVSRCFRSDAALQNKEVLSFHAVLEDVAKTSA